MSGDPPTRLRDVEEQNALIVRRRAANRIEILEAVLAAADELPLWRLEDAAIPDEEFEAVTRFRAALILAQAGRADLAAKAAVR